MCSILSLFKKQGKKKPHPYHIVFNLVLYDSTLGIYSEIHDIRWFHQIITTECTYTTLHEKAYYTSWLSDTAYCS